MMTTVGYVACAYVAIGVVVCTPGFFIDTMKPKEKRDWGAMEVVCAVLIWPYILWKMWEEVSA